ncbi:MAG: hypothetical protein IPK19_13365 [Chloroflexi bacterium]|nr:hypothetical protein [Chloroflexota bacterium]
MYGVVGADIAQEIALLVGEWHERRLKAALENGNVDPVHPVARTRALRRRVGILLIRAGQRLQSEVETVLHNPAPCVDNC